jgi:hypothetical protein
MLTDRFGRALTYLRLSVTGACNLKCLYCMPKGRDAACTASQCLDKDEIVRLVRIALSLGVKKVRITGGEPLLRKDILEIVKGISSLKGIEDLSLTTNGVLLGRYAAELKKAGFTDEEAASSDGPDFWMQRIKASLVWNEIRVDCGLEVIGEDFCQNKRVQIGVKGPFGGVNKVNIRIDKYRCGVMNFKYLAADFVCVPCNPSLLISSPSIYKLAPSSLVKSNWCQLSSVTTRLPVHFTIYHV